MESILTSIKKLLGITEDYEAFDTDIIIHINSALMVMNQLGIGVKGFVIDSAADTWEDFLGSTENVDAVKTVVYLRVRLAFDPPANSFVTSAIQEMIKEYEWRLNVQVDPGEPTE